MKKYSKGMASFVVMMMLSPVAAQAADGKVTFNGEVIDNTCTVKNKDKTVTLADGPALGAQQRGRDGGRGSLHYRSDELFPGDQCLGVLREGSKRFHGGPTKKHSD